MTVALRRGLFVTGTDTGVGKTVVTAALARALKSRGIDVGVMKPVATGCLSQNGTLLSGDAQRLLEAAQTDDPLELVSPHRFAPPVAPWVARGLSRRQTDGGQAKGRVPFSFDRIERAYQVLISRHEILLVEGIGGLLVPLDERHTVADLIRHLQLPVLIVARASLGTINHTLLTLEAARAAGLQVLGIVLNGRSAKGTVAERTNPRVIRSLSGVPIFGVIPAVRNPSPGKLSRYLKTTAILDAIQNAHGATPARQRSLSRADRAHLWHPFTQMSEWEKENPLIVESADGAYLTDVEGKRYLDGVSSLWVNIHGHRHPALDRALKSQVAQVAHSTLLGAANVPSILLARELIRCAPRNLTRVFYSDSGSTAVEIALKMAFQYWQQNGRPRRRRFVHFVNAYHGDTIGSMSVGGIDLFHQVYGPLLFKGFQVPSPYSYRCGLSRNCPPCSRGCLTPFEETLRKHHSEIAGVVVEPLVQGAAGMIAQPPGWLKRVESLCRRHDLFLIADEVAVGFGRTGTMFACEQEKVRPDFLCLAKGLTGGYLPLAATLTTERVYKGFLGSYASQRTFFHGHSYTGNPLACAVALENLRLFRRERLLSKLKPKVRFLTKELERFKALPHVGEVRHRGFMVGIELVDDKATKRPYPWESKMGIRVCRYLRGRGILLRPLGNVIVLMPPLSISIADLQFLCRETYSAIHSITQ